MEKIYTKKMQIPNIGVDCFGRLKTAWLLACVQEAAGEHSALLGAGKGEYNGRKLFWAVTRHRVQITRLPGAGETVTLKTWPCPTTRVAYPRATVAYDEAGNELFRAISLWVLMDVTSRAMILPGKSGVVVEGVDLGWELAAPGSLAPVEGENREERRVRFTDLDVNGHMNNTQYLNWVDDLLPGGYHRDHPVRDFTVCYLNEALEGQNLSLSWSLDGELQVDARCQDPEDTTKSRRIFAVKIVY